MTVFIIPLRKKILKNSKRSTQRLGKPEEALSNINNLKKS